MVRIILGAPVGSTGAVGIHTYAVSYDRPVCQGYIRLQEHRMCHTCRNTALSISSAACDTRTMSAQRRPTPVQGVTTHPRRRPTRSPAVGVAPLPRRDICSGKRSH